MEKDITEEEAVSLLRKYAISEDDYRAVLLHSLSVKTIAGRFAEKIKGIDKEFVRTAAILHDIGRFRFPPGNPDMMRHGVEGYDILIKEGLPRHARVSRNHIGIGITKDDVRKGNLPLPQEDMVPKTPEEMIIAYADNLDDNGKEMDEAWVERRFQERIGKEIIPRVKEFHMRIHKLLEDGVSRSS